MLHFLTLFQQKLMSTGPEHSMTGSRRYFEVFADFPKEPTTEGFLEALHYQCFGFMRNLHLKTFVHSEYFLVLSSKAG